MEISGSAAGRGHDAEIAQWRKASEGVAQQWVEEMGKRGVDGKALIADAQALIAQHSRK